jgi:hypothetical protein
VGLEDVLRSDWSFSISDPGEPPEMLLKSLDKCVLTQSLQAHEQKSFCLCMSFLYFVRSSKVNGSNFRTETGGTCEGMSSLVSLGCLLQQEMGASSALEARARSACKTSQDAQPRILFLFLTSSDRTRLFSPYAKTHPCTSGAVRWSIACC